MDKPGAANTERHSASPSEAFPPAATILIVEDHLPSRQFLATLLGYGKHRVLEASDGLEALAIARAEKPDLIVSDVLMPTMDGFEATKRIRAKEKGSGVRVPIIALTALAMKGDEERCLASGMDGYVSKPIKLEELFSAIQKLVPRVAALADAQIPFTRQPKTTVPK